MMPILAAIVIGAAAWLGAHMAETLKTMRREGKR